MPQIQLLDGKKISFTKSINGFDLTKKISKSLEKAALIMEVDGQLKDLSHEITKNSKVRIITSKDKEGLEVIRHDAAHIMAMAVQELFPGTQVTIGPVIENGFYYDFARKEPFTSDDLEKVEKKMSEIIDRDVKTKREVWKRDKAISHFKKIGEKYKAEIIESIPKNEELSVYHHGDTWHDLCRGPHLASSSKIGKAFKLTKVSGAYWRGNSDNEMLQRIYGTCWSSKKELDDYLHRLEEAEKRDHRKLGKEMDLFHFREESPGSVFWHEKGWLLFQRLVEYMRMKQRLAGYKGINTPELLDKTLWEKSGHWEKFGEHMFTSETPDEETLEVTNLILEIYKALGFEDVILKYSDRPEKRVGDDSIWDKSEAALLSAIKKSKLEYSINKGEGAFYGPKIEFVLRDAIGRDWQCGTLQVDLNLPNRLGATFVDKDGTKKVPVMLHRALFGSLERFIGILIENYAGKLPFWLSPAQAVVCPIAEENNDYVKKLFEDLFKEGIKCEVDLRNEKINYKIREHSLAKIPFIIVCGKKEVADNTVTVRKLGSEKQETIKKEEFIKNMLKANKLPLN